MEDPFSSWSVFLALCMPAPGMGQIDVPIPLPAAGRQKAAVEKETTGAVPNYPQLVDISASTGIDFKHLSSPEAKFIVESMSGGVRSSIRKRDCDRAEVSYAAGQDSGEPPLGVGLKGENVSETTVGRKSPNESSRRSMSNTLYTQGCPGGSKVRIATF